MVPTQSLAQILTLLSQLIGFASITPEDAGCQEHMIRFLDASGFVIQRFNNPPVANFFARYGTKPPLLVFAGHTDVVPLGDEKLWHSPPFQLTVKDGIGFGRGVADMKGSLAAMMIAAERFVQDNPEFPGSIGFLITSGEEGDHFDKGTPYVMSELQKQGIHIDYCIVGEPSSTKEIADVIKIGRRGSLTFKLKLEGKQGHVAYPHLAINPIHTISPVLKELTSTIWDNGNAFFPATSMQITHIAAGGEATNIIPGALKLYGNFRFSNEQTASGLQKHVEAIFERHHLKPDIHWRLNGEPFLTAQGKLLDTTVDVISKIRQKKPELSTSGGTSDGRFIAPYGVEVIELGPVNASIHQVNENIDLASLETLSEIYYQISAGVFGR
jgi:succinyl-diaminopimelate desuccinylase